jgi:hypothetical protein
MNEEDESHWFSGTLQEPMGMKGMEVGEATRKEEKEKNLSRQTIIGFAMFKWGTVKLWRRSSIITF